LRNHRYFYSVRYGVGDNTQYALHKKYGPFVRIAPNQIQINDPAAIEAVYGPKNDFPKGDFYKGFKSGISKRLDTFSEPNKKAHANRRRITAPLYTQGAVLDYEPMVDRVIALFYKRMEEFAESGEVTDISVWLRKYTFDVIGEIFYGREGGFGFLRDNIDYNNWCHILKVMPPWVSAIMDLPKGLRTLYMMSQMVFKESRDGLKGFFTIIEQSHVAVKERREELASSKVTTRHDVLSKLCKIVDEEGEKLDFTDLDVTTELWMIIWAGSDTTAIALTAIFYLLHKHPHTLAKLRAEIEDAFATGKLTYPIRYRDGIKLPYLHAVVMEAMRYHPSLGTGLPRVVPEGGAEVCGNYLPGGYGVIMNSAAVQFDKGVFGEDSEEFIPERWLRGGERVAANMERHMLQFGYGPRICMGRHITNTEMYKLLPTVLRDFDFELVTPKWKVWRGWFHQQEDVNVKITRRRPYSPSVLV